jgi:gas vesicle protein GvpL/GvpF
VRRTDSSATYLYCLVHGPRPPGGRAPRGLAGAGPVRLLDAGDRLWLVAADAPLTRYGAAPIERGLRDLTWVSACAMGHESVVEHFARRTTVIPMKLFTLFATDARALAHVQRTRRRLDRLIARVGGRQEWGVRLALDEGRAFRALAGATGATRAGSTGTGFLLKKKQERDAVHRLRRGAGAEADRLFQRLARLADDARRQTPGQGVAAVRVILDAAFLVRSGRAAAFRAAAARLGRRLAGSGYHLTLSGPWPPYTFVAEPA